MDEPENAAAPLTRAEVWDGLAFVGVLVLLAVIAGALGIAKMWHAL